MFYKTEFFIGSVLSLTNEVLFAIIKMITVENKGGDIHE